MKSYIAYYARQELRLQARSLSEAQLKAAARFGVRDTLIYVCRKGV
jgi:hypothetical protein